MMSHVDQAHCVDQSMRDILNIDKPFGGIPIVFSGDPRQILPVVHHGNQSHIVNASIHLSLLWSHILQIKLLTNMCITQEEKDFSTYELSIGNGTAKTYPEIGEDVIQIPKQYLVNTMEVLISKVFPFIENGYTDKYFVS